MWGGSGVGGIGGSFLNNNNLLQIINIKERSPI